MAQIKKIISYAEKNFVEKSRLLSFNLLPKRIDQIKQVLTESKCDSSLLEPI